MFVISSKSNLLKLCLYQYVSPKEAIKKKNEWAQMNETIHMKTELQLTHLREYASQSKRYSDRALRSKKEIWEEVEEEGRGLRPGAEEGAMGD